MKKSWLDKIWQGLKIAHNEDDDSQDRWKAPSLHFRSWWRGTIDLIPLMLPEYAAGEKKGIEFLPLSAHIIITDDLFWP